MVRAQKAMFCARGVFAYQLPIFFSHIQTYFKCDMLVFALFLFVPCASECLSAGASYSLQGSGQLYGGGGAHRVPSAVALHRRIRR